MLALAQGTMLSDETVLALMLIESKKTIKGYVFLAVGGGFVLCRTFPYCK